MLGNFIKKPYVYAICFSIVLMGINIYALLKTFVIAEVQGYVVTEAMESTATSTDDSDLDTIEADEGADILKEDDTTQSEDTVQENTSSSAVITENSYTDENISITIETIEAYDSTVYVADITLSSAQYLKTALANNAYGTNVVALTSATAESNDAIFAVNGDYYGANKKGYVIKNGVIYRSSVRSDTEYDDLVIYADGSFGIINESEVSAEELLESGVVNLFAFGPTLVENGEVIVSTSDEVSQAKSGNPRTAIGIIDELHYIIVVSDGRTSESPGLSLYELASVMQSYGVTTAYNLDGGGSSTMYFNGEVINNPTTNGKTIKERQVSDIVYIGY